MRNPPARTRGMAATSLCLLALSGVCAWTTCAQNTARDLVTTRDVPASFFHACAFVSVDFQPSVRAHVTEVPEFWKSANVTVEDINTANDFLVDVALPNARKIADACRDLNMPMILVHWGYRFRDAMDLDPMIRREFLQRFGTDYSKWPHYAGAPDSRPADILGVRDGEYVIAKTAHDAFRSSNLGFVLQNLEVKNIVFVGGHTGACLGMTAKAAKRLGYTTLCVEDATNDAFESTRRQRIQQTGYDYVIKTADFLRVTARLRDRVAP